MPSASSSSSQGLGIRVCRPAPGLGLRVSGCFMRLASGPRFGLLFLPSGTHEATLAQNWGGSRVSPPPAQACPPFSWLLAEASKLPCLSPTAQGGLPGQILGRTVVTAMATD